MVFGRRQCINNVTPRQNSLATNLEFKAVVVEDSLEFYITFVQSLIKEYLIARP